MSNARQEIDYLCSVVQAIQDESISCIRNINMILTRTRYLPPPIQLKSTALTTAEWAAGGLYSRVSPSAVQELPRIDCYCRLRIYESFSECFEGTVFKSLIKLNRGLISNLLIPCTPELADILCITRDPGNPVSKILYKLIRRANIDSLVIQSVIYIYAYCILRVSTINTSSSSFSQRS